MVWSPLITSPWHSTFSENVWVGKGFEVVPNVGCGPLPVTVTTRIIPFLVGNPYEPSFVTVTARGPPTRYITPYSLPKCWICVLLTHIFLGGACQHLDTLHDGKINMTILLSGPFINLHVPLLQCFGRTEALFTYT